MMKLGRTLNIGLPARESFRSWTLRVEGWALDVGRLSRASARPRHGEQALVAPYHFEDR
jgi:hypothetical protein